MSTASAWMDGFLEMSFAKWLRTPEGIARRVLDLWVLSLLTYFNYWTFFLKTPNCRSPSGEQLTFISKNGNSLTRFKRSRGFIRVSLHIYFLLCSIKIKFPFLKQCWMVDLLDFWCNICTKDGDFLFFFIIEFSIGIGRMII